MSKIDMSDIELNDEIEIAEFADELSDEALDGHGVRFCSQYSL